MKKLFILFGLILISCSSDKTEEPTVNPTEKCYNILTRGYDGRGDYIIIKYDGFTQKRYAVGNYQDYINQSTLCEPINLTQQEL